MKPTQESRARSPYWAHFTESERQALSQLPPDDVTSEMKLLRVKVTDALQSLQADLSRDLARQALDTFRRVASCQGDLHAVHARGRASNPALEHAVSAAYRLARQELGILDYLSTVSPNTQEHE